MQKKNKLSEPSYLRLLLRSFLSSSKIYIYLTYLKNKFNLPENITHNDTDIVVEGYPRTGNSYLYLLIKQINPKIKISSHTHTIANVKLGISLKKKVIILIRPPLESCVSRLVFQKNLTTILALKDYFIFYSHIQKKQKELIIINSDKMFNDNIYLINKLKGIFGKEIFNISIDQNKIFSDLKKENDLVSSREETLGYPSIKKNELKKINEKRILSDKKCHILLKNCQLLYDQLIYE